MKWLMLVALAFMASPFLLAVVSDPRCPVCGHSAARLPDHRFKCRDPLCGHGWTDPAAS